MSTTVPDRFPDPLQQNNITARVIREDIYRPAVMQDDWRVFVVVGREGSGKSLTCASILKAVDPTFSVDRMHFNAVPFLQDIASAPDRPGVAVGGDEVGVSFGKRTWHDREQIESNQALQTARDYNRIVGLTIPRLEELDSQLIGRIHVLIETVSKKDGEWAKVKWKRVDPSRAGENKVYKKHPRVSINNRTRRVTRLRIGPPPDDFVKPYQEKKRKWKDELFDSVISNYQEDEEDSEALQTPKEIAQDILSGDVTEYISDNNGQRYLDADLIAYDYNIGDRRSKKVKKAVLRESDLDVL